MNHWWAAWIAVGLAVEVVAVVSNRQTLSMTLRRVIDSPGRKLAWAGFCVWGIHHILD